jgi:hypothetical protein
MEGPTDSEPSSSGESESGLNRNVQLTYFGLRLGIVILVLMLFVSVIHVITSEDDWLRSLSSYYYTPARAVFVGSLCAIGAALIVYRGNTDTENVLLDFAGFLAFIVAFVPTDLDESCAYCTGLAAEDVSAAISNNVVAAISVGFAAVVSGLFARRLLGLRQDKQSRAARVSMWVSFVAIVLAGGYFAFNTDQVEEHGHEVAAIFFFVFIILVVAVNARGLSGRLDWTIDAVWAAAKNRYGVIAVLMVLTLVVLFLTRNGFDHWILALEALLIGQFALFWGFQTEELRGSDSR